MSPLCWTAKGNYNFPFLKLHFIDAMGINQIEYECIFESYKYCFTAATAEWNFNVIKIYMKLFHRFLTIFSHDHTLLVFRNCSVMLILVTWISLILSDEVCVCQSMSPLLLNVILSYKLWSIMMTFCEPEMPISTFCSRNSMNL